MSKPLKLWQRLAVRLLLWVIVIGSDDDEDRELLKDYLNPDWR